MSADSTTFCLAVAMVASRTGFGSFSTTSVLGVGMTLLTSTAALLAVGSAVDLHAALRGLGLDELARERGHDTKRDDLAELLATLQIVARALFVPATLLGTLHLALATSPRSGASALVDWLGALAYSALATLILALLARASARLSPARGRWLCVALLVVPELLKLGGGDAYGPWSLLALLRQALLPLGGGGP